MSFTPTYVMVGEAPNSRGNWKNLDVVLACKAVKKRPVAGTMGWLRTNHRRLFNFTMRTIHVNLLQEYPGKARGGSAFPMDRARERAGLFVRNLEKPAIVTVEGREFHAFATRRFTKPDLVLLAGWRVARAFGIQHGTKEYFVVDHECDRMGGLPTVVVPHPSGINRWWNDAGNQTIARMFLEGLGEVD